MAYRHAYALPLDQIMHLELYLAEGRIAPEDVPAAKAELARLRGFPDLYPDESTTQALARLGYGRASHNPGDETCRQLRSGSGQTVGACMGRHVYRRSDGALVLALGCSPPVGVANEWIRKGCPDG